MSASPSTVSLPGGVPGPSTCENPRVSESFFLFWGIAFQLAGVIVTIFGARKVWKGLKSSDDRFLAPFILAGQWLWRQVRRFGRKLGIRFSVRDIRVGIVDVVVSADGLLQVSKRFPPIPATATTQEAIHLLDERLREVQTQLQDQDWEIEQRVRAKIEKVTAEQKAMSKEAEDRNQEERKKAVVGLRLEAYGFILLTIGTLIQAYSSYLGIDAPSPTP